MKVSFITNINVIHSQRWIDPLISSGYEISIFSYRRNPPKLSGVDNHIDLTKFGDIRKIRFLYWGVRVRNILSKYRPDILHAHQIQSAGWIGAITGYHPFIVSAWGSDLLIEPNKSVIRKMLVKTVLNRCDYLTVPSKHMQKAAINLGFPQERIKLIPWGVETDIFKSVPDDRQESRSALNLPLEAPIIFCPRRIVPICNIDIVVDVINNIKFNFPELRLILLTYNYDYDYYKKILNQISRLGINDHVIWLPEQTTSGHMARLYRLSDTVVSIPSSEGYGFTVYEAMACGVPTIITDLPVFQDEIIDRRHTLKVPPRDIEQTSLALSSLLKDNSQKKHLVANAFQISANHSVSRRIHLVEDFYQEIAHQR